ncbi:MAG: acylphosphatase [Pseudooceanicola sp.]
MSYQCQSVRVTGRVQGVAFRAWTQGQAQSLGLTGWVRNKGDGSVEALICGEKNPVEEMITAFWQGPGAAEVRDVQASPADPDTPPQGFEILR